MASPQGLCHFLSTKWFKEKYQPREAFWRNLSVKSPSAIVFYNQTESPKPPLHFYHNNTRVWILVTAPSFRFAMLEFFVMIKYFLKCPWPYWVVQSWTTDQAFNSLVPLANWIQTIKWLLTEKPYNEICECATSHEKLWLKTRPD